MRITAKQFIAWDKYGVPMPKMGDEITASEVAALDIPALDRIMILLYAAGPRKAAWLAIEFASRAAAIVAGLDCPGISAVEDSIAASAAASSSASAACDSVALERAFVACCAAIEAIARAAESAAPGEGLSAAAYAAECERQIKRCLAALDEC